MQKNRRMGIDRRVAMAGLGSLVAAATLRGTAQAGAAKEPPILVEQVTAGTLPPMAERLPKTPRLINMVAMGRTPGHHGGELTVLMADQRDLRMMTIYSYTRLVVFNLDGDIVPDILEDCSVEEGRIFTLTLREGHRWSDGKPLTSDDFVYWWRDVANHKRLSPGGPPASLILEGKPPQVEALDSRRIRYEWTVPNPAFLPALAATQPLYILMPAHYMRRFHADHADAETLKSAVKAAGVKDWVALHEQKSRQYRPENPDLPSLDPWLPRVAPPAERFSFERNPYFHRVDERGQQLPYIDRISINITTASLIPAKVGAGDSDLQARYLQFDNYTFLKKAEKHRPFRVHLWERSEGAKIALYPNLNCQDLSWRAVLRDRRVRHALSLAINRRDINNVAFFGLGTPSANTMIKGSPLYSVARAEAFIQYDPERAKRLLDEAGLKRRDWDGVRLLPDGRRAEITIETAGNNPEETDALEMILANFRDIGLLGVGRSSQRELFRRRILIGETAMALWSGLDNGIASPEMDPYELVPCNSAQFQWPRFGQFVESAGQSGDAIDLPEVARLADLHQQWKRSRSTGERRRLWNEILDIHASEIFTIGIVNRTFQPVVVMRKLRNVPEKALFSFEPTAFFGAYNMDAFWLADDGDPA